MPDEDRADFRGAAGADDHVVDGDGLADHEVGFLDRLAADQRFGGFFGLEDAGHDLPGPRMAAGGVGAGAELADQHDLVAPRVVGQHGGRWAALEYFTLQDAALAALVEAVAEAVAADAEKTLEGDDMVDQLDGFIGQGTRRHGVSECKKGRSRDKSGP